MEGALPDWGYAGLVTRLTRKAFNPTILEIWKQ
jgi:hypothetical protein